MKSKYRTYNRIALPVILIFIYFFGIKPSFDYDKKSEETLQKLYLNLSGIVTDIHTSDEHGVGMIYLNNVISNIKTYDDRKNSKYFLCNSEQ